MAKEKQEESQIDIYEYELEEANDIINKLCYNWNLIKICYELWESEIRVERGPKKKLYEVVGVGMNYINEICALRVKQKTCKRVFNVTNKTEVLLYLQGSKKILEITKFNEYILLNIVYNDWISKKKQVAHFTGRDDAKLKASQIKLQRTENWLERNYKNEECLKDYLNAFKNHVKEIIAEDIKKEYIEKENPLKMIKEYLLEKYTKITVEEQAKYLEETEYLLLAMNCDVLTGFTDPNLKILKDTLEKFLCRVEAEYNYRDARRQEKEIMKEVGKKYRIL